MLKLKGHAAPVETLFSSLSYSKPKIRNKISPENLKIIGTVRKSLRRSIPVTAGPVKRVREAGVNADMGTNTLLPELDQDHVDEVDFVEDLQQIFDDDDDDDDEQFDELLHEST